MNPAPPVTIVVFLLKTHLTKILKNFHTRHCLSGHCCCSLGLIHELIAVQLFKRHDATKRILTHYSIVPRRLGCDISSSIFIAGEILPTGDFFILLSSTGYLFSNYFIKRTFGNANLHCESRFIGTKQSHGGVLACHAEFPLSSIRFRATLRMTKAKGSE